MNDFRFVPGKIHLDMSKPENTAWIWNQDAINNGMDKLGHWRTATQKEKESLCGTGEYTMAFMFDLNKGANGHADFACMYNMPSRVFSNPRYVKAACEVFNRYFIHFKPPATIVCGEPRLKDEDSVKS